MIIRFTENELKNIKIVHLPKRSLPEEYLDEREKSWEKRLAKIKGTQKELWNGEIYTIESIAQPNLAEVTIYMSECEFKDIVFRVDAGHDYVLEKYGDDYFFQFATADCIPMTKDNKFVFGIRSDKTVIAEGSIGLIGGTLNKDEIRIDSVQDIHKAMLSEIEEESLIETTEDQIQLFSLNQFNGKCEFLYLLKLEISSAEINRIYRPGEFSQLICLSRDEVSAYSKTPTAVFSYFKDYAHLIPKL